MKGELCVSTLLPCICTPVAGFAWVFSIWVVSSALSLTHLIEHLAYESRDPGGGIAVENTTNKSIAFKACRVGSDTSSGGVWRAWVFLMKRHRAMWQTPVSSACF